jgi:hypothetical protein
MCRHYRHAILLGSLALSGCVFLPSATKPTPPQNATQPPRERLLAFQQAREGATAIVVVTRDTGLFGIACYYAVEINGSIAARLRGGETSRFYLVPGEARIKAVPDPEATGLCSIGQGEDRSDLHVSVAPDETKRFRLHIDKHGGLHILPE